MDGDAETPEGDAASANASGPCGRRPPRPTDRRAGRRSRPDRKDAADTLARVEDVLAAIYAMTDEQIEMTPMLVAEWVGRNRHTLYTALQENGLIEKYEAEEGTSGKSYRMRITGRGVYEHRAREARAIRSAAAKTVRSWRAK